MEQPEKRKYRVGLIGTGGMGAERAQCISDHPDLALVAVAGRNRQARESLAARHGAAALGDWRELVATTELDGVFIATLPDTHAEIGLGALDHGKHVFVEPPLAIDMAGADSVVEAARSSGLVVRVGHSPVLRPAARVVAQQVERLGGPVLDDVRVHFGDDLRSGRVAGFDVRVTGHPMLYAITLGLPAIFGKGPIDSVRASTRGVGDGPVFENCVATAEITFASGVVTTIAYLRGYEWAGPGWRTVACGNGSVRSVDGTDGVEVTTARGTELVAVPKDDAYETEIEEFVRAIRTGATPTFTLSDAHRVVAIADAAEKSSRSGQAVGLDHGGVR